MSVTYPDLNNTTFPDSIQNFIEAMDVTGDDGSLIGQYQSAIESGNMSLAQSIYAQIENADNKIINAIKINTIQDTIIALERFFNQDINTYIQQKQQQWEKYINQFSLIGIYNGNNSYLKNNLVYYPNESSNFIYIALQNVPINTPPSNSTYWRQLTIQGLKGDKGDGLSFVGSWDSVVNYEEDTLVSYNNSLYISNTNNNSGNNPEQDNINWSLVGTLEPAIYPLVDINTPPQDLNDGDLWFGELAGEN